MTPRTIISGVTVVDVRTGALAADREVVLEAQRIVAIEPTGTTTPRAEDTELEPGQVFVVPGFIDSHAHALNLDDPSATLQLMLASGITGFRQMSGTSELLRRRASNQLTLPADSPALIALCGEILTPANARTPEQAIETIRRQKGEGADFIKIPVADAATFEAALREAAAEGIPIAGHLPVSADPRTAARIGFSIEHLGPGIPLLAACSTEEDAIREKLGSGVQRRLPPLPKPLLQRIFAMLLPRIVLNPVALQTRGSVALLQHAIDTFDEGKARDLADLLVAEGTWVTPTLIRQVTSQLADEPARSANPDLKYVKQSTLNLWARFARKFGKKYSAAEHATFAAQHQLELRIVRIFDLQGVQMTAGTDATGAGWIVAGASLHQEFDLLAEAGLSPLRILQMATINAAALAGVEDSLGTVEVGKAADLVLLRADPIASSQNLHAVVGVVRGGRSYGPTDLDAMTARIAEARSIT